MQTDDGAFPSNPMTGGRAMAREKREVEIRSRADTLGLTSPEVRPWPVTPPPPQEEVLKVYAKRKAEQFGKWCEDNLRFEYGFGKAEALQGLKVLDIGLWRMGHKFASSCLAEAGAEVICIEPPAGDPMRKLTPLGGRSTCWSTGRPGKNAVSISSPRW